MVLTDAGFKTALDGKVLYFYIIYNNYAKGQFETWTIFKLSNGFKTGQMALNLARQM